MVDYKTTIVKELSKLNLPVYYEMFLTRDTGLPCISYLEDSNYDEKIGDTLTYSHISYSIKIWTKSVKEMSEYSIKIDRVMHDLGFRRSNSIELWQDTIGQRELDYYGVFVENN